MRFFYVVFLGITLRVALSAKSFFRVSKKDTATIANAKLPENFSLNFEPSFQKHHCSIW